MVDIKKMPGHLGRRFQQIAVAAFHNEVDALGHGITPVQFAAMATVCEHPGVDQATLAGLIAYDRATITGVVDRLVQKEFLTRQVSQRDRRARELSITRKGLQVLEDITPAVESAQKNMLCGLTASEANELIRLLTKTIEAGNELSRAPMIPPPKNTG